VKKDERKNILYVSNNEKDLYAGELVAGGLSWLSGQSPKLPEKVWAKIRYKSEAAEAILRGRTSPKSLRVEFLKPQRAITPGQSVVFYTKAGEVLGGGVIR
jgi:tRNA-specific 2-thiouridylase